MNRAECTETIEEDDDEEEKDGVGEVARVEASEVGADVEVIDGMRLCSGDEDEVDRLIEEMEEARDG